MTVCPGCGHDFASTEAFDTHRIGTHEYTHPEGLRLDPPQKDGRRCLNVDEMVDAGWARDARGRWVHPRALRKRAHKGGYTPTEATNTPPATSDPPDSDGTLSEQISALEDGS